MYGGKRLLRLGIFAACVWLAGNAGLGSPPLPVPGPPNLPEHIGPVVPSAAPLRSSAEPSVRHLYESARKRFEGIDSYIVRLVRRESIRGELKPREIILLAFRKEPWSVYMKWIGKEGRGREGVYVKGRYGDRIHTRLAAGDIPLVPAGRRMALEPDGAMMRSASRHPITELGIGAAIDRIGLVLAAEERGDRKLGSLELVGPIRRPEFAERVIGIEHTIPAGLEAALPRGGQRTYYFDPGTGLPMLLITRDDIRQEAEYYNYDRLQLAVNLDEADFDPDRLWTRPAEASPPAKAMRDLPKRDRP